MDEARGRTLVQGSTDVRPVVFSVALKRVVQAVRQRHAIVQARLSRAVPPSLIVQRYY